MLNCLLLLSRRWDVHILIPSKGTVSESLQLGFRMSLWLIYANVDSPVGITEIAIRDNNEGEKGYTSPISAVTVPTQILGEAARDIRKPISENVVIRMDQCIVEGAVPMRERSRWGSLPGKVRRTSSLKESL